MVIMLVIQYLRHVRGKAKVFGGFKGLGSCNIVQLAPAPV